MRRGEIWWVDFDPAQGGEINKTRPAIIISNDSANRYLNRVQVIPITSNVKKLYPCECLVIVKGKQSKAMTDQITTASKDRLKNKIGEINDEDMKDVERIICVQLNLSKTQ